MHKIDNRQRIYSLPDQQTCHQIRSEPRPEDLLHSLIVETFQSLREMVNPITGLPVDSTYPIPQKQTSISNIAALITSESIAPNVQLSTRKESAERIGKALHFLDNAPNYEGMYPNWWESDTGQILERWPGDTQPLKPQISTVDMGNLKLALLVAENIVPEVSELAYKLSSRIDLRKFYNPDMGLMRGSLPLRRHDDPGKSNFEIDTDVQKWHYGALFTEASGAGMLGVNEGSIPQSHLLLLSMHQYMLHQYREGIVGKHLKTWGGSMFEAYLLRQFMNGGTLHEIWKHSGQHLLQSQIAKRSARNKWLHGSSPSMFNFSHEKNTFVGYAEFGTQDEALFAGGYPSGISPSQEGQILGEAVQVITPHAMLLSMADAPTATLEAINEINCLFPYKGWGVPGSVSSTGDMFRGHVFWDQFLSLLGPVNYITGNMLPKAMESVFRKLGSFFRRINPLDQVRVVSELRPHLHLNDQVLLDQWLEITQLPPMVISDQLTRQHAKIAAAVANYSD